MKGFYIEIIYNFDFNMPLDLSKKLVYFVYAVLPTSYQIKLHDVPNISVHLTLHLTSCIF